MIRYLNNILVSQASRLFASAVCGEGLWNKGFDGSLPWVVTSDVDLWPIGNASFYSLSHPERNSGLLLNYNALPRVSLRGDTFPEFPMANVGFTLPMWQEVMDVDCTCNVDSNAYPACLQTVVDAVNNNSREYFGYSTEGQETSLSTWSYDQVLLSYKISLNPHIQSEIEYIARGPEQVNPGPDRIDRSQWPDVKWNKESLASYNDAHLLRPGYGKYQWSRLRPLIQSLLYGDDGDMARIDEYYRDYTTALNS